MFSVGRARERAKGDVAGGRGLLLSTAAIVRLGGVGVNECWPRLVVSPLHGTTLGCGLTTWPFGLKVLNLLRPARGAGQAGSNLVNVAKSGAR